MTGSSAGLWDWDIVGNRIHFSSALEGIRGYSDSEIGDSPEDGARAFIPRSHES